MGLCRQSAGSAFELLSRFIILKAFLPRSKRLSIKNLQCSRPGFDPWVGKIPWRRERLPTPVFWPGEFQGVHGVAKSQIQLSNFHFQPRGCVVTQPCPTLCYTVDCSPPGSSVHGILQARIGVGRHSLLQRSFLIQGSNLDLLHCRQILYHLSHQRSPSSGGYWGHISW